MNNDSSMQMDNNKPAAELVNEILHSKFEIPMEKLQPGAHLKNDLNLDSLDFVDMFVLLEQRIGSTPQDIDFMKIQTLGDIHQMLTDLQKAQPKQ